MKTHINYFGGIDKVLMIEEPLEGEEDFFAYENGRLTRQKGYYIFYEQNEAMQRYMVENGDGDSVDDKEDFDDRAVRNFRTVVQEKKEVSGQKRVMTFLYMASTFLVMVVLVIGITLINNYEKMEGLETTLSEISESLERQEGQTVEMLAKEGESQELVDAVEAENANVQTEEPQESEEPEVSEEPQDSQEPETSEEQAVEPETPSEEPEDAPEEQAPEEGIEAISQSVESIQEKYTVRKGDTLLKISMKIYGNADKIDDICQLNGIKNSDHILVGQKLLLP